jgi:glycosyltransferase involved in cell wall biosynthesis
MKCPILMADNVETKIMQLSIIIPAKNEALGLKPLLATLRGDWPEAEIIVVDDGSDDDTGKVARQSGARVIRHPYSMGNGAAIKTGARNAKGDVLVFMDADGQHAPKDIARLLARFDEGFDMVVGARESDTHASTTRRLGNGLYNNLASWITGQKIDDLTSGFRVVDAKKFREFIYILPNQFSYPSTITMAFLRSAYSVDFIPIRAETRVGKSHLNPLKDGYRFLIIIFKVATLFSPLKVFVPVSLLFFLLGLFYYLFTYISDARFTNMGVLLFVTSVLVFLIGLVSEQITMLTYLRRQD